MSGYFSRLARASVERAKGPSAAPTPGVETGALVDDVETVHEPPTSDATDLPDVSASPTRGSGATESHGAPVAESQAVPSRRSHPLPKRSVEMTHPAAGASRLGAEPAHPSHSSGPQSLTGRGPLPIDDDPPAPTPRGPGQCERSGPHPGVPSEPVVVPIVDTEQSPTPRERLRSTEVKENSVLEPRPEPAAGYDRIDTRSSIDAAPTLRETVVLSPTLAPPSDTVQKKRDATSFRPRHAAETRVARAPQVEVRIGTIAIEVQGADPQAGPASRRSEATTRRDTRAAQLGTMRHLRRMYWRGF